MVDHSMHVEKQPFVITHCKAMEHIESSLYRWEWDDAGNDMVKHNES